MPRKVVPLVTGEVYHVYNRGVDKRIVFNTKTDYLRFYQSLLYFNTVEPVESFRTARTHDTEQHPALVSIHAYSLLPNHFHFLIEQMSDGGISEFMKRVLGGYTSHYNEHHSRTGSLFQGTYKRVHVDSDEQYRYLFAYVNENHIVHGIPRPNEIVCSSSLHHQGIAKSKLISSIVFQAEYNVNTSRTLAQDIFERRTVEKGLLHEKE
jgi:putative transposase